jgi:hypothetical protein
MSNAKRNDLCVVSVDPVVAVAVRQQTLVVLEANHHYFEDIEEYGPEAQYALSVIYRDAFAVLDAVGWDPEVEPAPATDVPLTGGHVEQLRRRRFELGHRNIDRLAHDEPRADLERDRATAQALDRLLAAYARTRVEQSREEPS